MSENKKIHVFIVGSKGIPAQYGGFETFVENLTARKKSEDIRYHVSCMNNDEKHFEYNGADCFNVKLPLKGAPGRILHVSRVLSFVEKWKKENPCEKAIVYILGCRIGPLLIPHAKKLHKLGIKIFVNPDGLEWKRDKWSKAEKAFLKYCEKCLVVNSNLAICDSKNIEKYILETYPTMEGKTTYIAYGADVSPSTCSEEKLDEWLEKHKLSRENYYLIVGRFVPENNYETMIKEFMKSNTNKDFAIITNVNDKFLNELEEKLHYKKDSRIKFVGTVYDKELLMKIRENAYGYFHGHEVGGTNPSLLEALGSTNLNLLLDVGFNKEVAEDAALYWTKKENNLASLIEKADTLSKKEIEELGKKAKKRITDNYSWEIISDKYKEIFISRCL